MQSKKIKIMKVETRKLSFGIILLTFLVLPRIGYANSISCKSEAISYELNDARDFATGEAKEKLQIRFAPVLEAIVDTYSGKHGDFSIEREAVLSKVTKSVFTTYCTVEQKMAKTHENGQEMYYALVKMSIQSERLLKAMEIYVLPKAGDNRRVHNRKVEQLQKVIEAEFENDLIISDGVEPSKPRRKP